MLPPKVLYLQMDMPDGHQDLKIDTLKDLEHFNNMKNLQNSVTINLVKPTAKVNSRLQKSKLKTLVNIFEKENQRIQNSEKEVPKSENSNWKRHFLRNKNGDAAIIQEVQQNSQKQFHSLPHDMKTQSIYTNEGPIINRKTNRTTQDENELTSTREEVNNILDDNEYGRKDHGSEYDSAVSSAPPSISPQPHPGNMQTTDIWQTIRTYSTDIEKLQKDVDALQAENERLRSELEIAKDEILDNERTVVEAAKNNTKMKSLLDRVKHLEHQENELLNECNELREQNELLEFRILEFEDNNEKWSTPAVQQETKNQVNNAEQTTEQESFWNVGAMNSNNGTYPDIYEYTNKELSLRITKMLHDLSLPNEDQTCLKQVLSLLSQESSASSSNATSGPDSFSTNSFSDDESSDFEFVTSSKSSSSSAYTSDKLNPMNKHLNDSFKSSGRVENNSRMVATVQPYNSSQTVQIVAPHNSPNESTRISRTITTPPSNNYWQNSSLSESGVFVESDFFSDASVEHNASTQATRVESREPVATLTAVVPSTSIAHHQTYLNDSKRLQYYQNRLRQLENKVLVYESSGDMQAKHLVDRLQRELYMEKELKELRDRVEFLESENAQLEEAKCEFEEAENDTRLRLQRLELDLEILSQRNVELELSKEALSAKYKDCRSECLILREDLSANEIQLRNISEDKRKVKENLEFLHSILPLLIAYNLVIDKRTESGEEVSNVTSSEKVAKNAGPQNSEEVYGNNDFSCCIKLKNEVHCLQTQLRQCKERCHEAMESADLHWLDLEMEYKEREKIASAKEASLKQKITQLESILHADSCAANEKITQMEETENELKNCLKRIVKEQKDILNDHQNILHDYESCRDELLQLKEAMKLLNEELEKEKNRNTVLQSELCVAQKIHSDTDICHRSALKVLQTDNSYLRKEFKNCEVTNGELREEVATLEQEIERLQLQLKCLQSRICELMEEIRTKEEMCSRLENEVKCNEGKCLALELGNSKAKHFKYTNSSSKNENDVREWFI